MAANLFENDKKGLCFMAKRHSISCSRAFNASDFKKRITVRAVRYSGAAFRCALAAVLAAFFAMPSVSPAARTAVEGDDYELDDKFLYIVDDGRATVAGIYDSPAGGDIAIPSEFNGYPVTAIGENAFVGLSMMCYKIRKLLHA